MFEIAEELKKLPDQPGVYIMHDSRDAIIYIGKAVSLRKRVHQYFQASHDEGIKKAQMVKQIARFEYIITDSELEALVLECNLIKEHRPKYNTMLRDDKTYPYIRVTVGEDFPRVLFSRQQKKDRSRYFGPYTSAGAVKDTIELINKLYQLRTCNRNLPKDIGKDRPCLNYHIHQCNAPCQGYISKEEYRQRVDAAVEFLNGNYAPILKSLQEKMMVASEEMQFEKAIEYRDLLNSVKQIAQKQKIIFRTFPDNMFCFLHRQRHIFLRKVFFLYDFNYCFVIILASRNKHKIAYLNGIVIRNIIVALVSIFKLYTAIDNIIVTAPYLSIHRRVHNFAPPIERHKFKD